MTYRIDVLSNGLRVASEAIAHAHSAAFAIAVNVGARHETNDQQGISHLIEHMAFKGTSRLSAKEIAEAFDLMGGDINAYTSHEHTVYYAKVLKEYAADALKLLCEIVADPALAEDELAREREVILQEIAMHEDSPDSLVFDLFQASCYGDSPLGRSILGTTDSVRAHRREALAHYIRSHYVPGRMVITAAGAVDHTRVREVVEQAFSHVPLSETLQPLTTAKFIGARQKHVKTLEQVQVVLGYEAVPSHHDDFMALQVFTTMLGGGMSSRLFQEIRERLGLCYSVSSFMTGYQDSGVLGVYSACAREQLPELLGAILRVLDSASAPPSADELLRAKNQLKAGIVMTRESTSSIAEWMARHLLVYGRYRPAEELLASIEAITPDHMRALYARYVQGLSPALSLLGPVKGMDHLLKEPARAA